MDLSVCLVVTKSVIDAALGTQDEEKIPYVIAVDTAEPTTGDNYLGHLKVAIQSLLSEFYPKLCMGLALRMIWASMDNNDDIWKGDQ